MRILKVNKREQEIIQSGNLILLKEKIGEAEAIWHEKLLQTTTDHRHVQGVYTVLKDIKDLLT